MHSFLIKISSGVFLAFFTLLSSCSSLITYYHGIGEPHIYEQLGRISPADSGVTPIIYRETKVTVDVSLSIGDQEITGFMIVDTGFEGSFFDARKLGDILHHADASEYEFRQPLPTVFNITGRGYYIGPIEAEGFTVEHGLFRVLDMSRANMALFSDHRIEKNFLGIIGRDILLQQPVNLNLAEGYIEVFRELPELDEYTSWQWWDGDYKNKEWQIPPFAIWMAENEYPVIFDTGAQVSFFPLHITHQLAAQSPERWMNVDMITPNRRRRERMAGLLDTYSINQGGNSLKFSDMVVYDQGFNSFEHTIGMQHLHRYSIIIDPEHGRIHTKEIPGNEYVNHFSRENFIFTIDPLYRSPNFGFTTHDTDDGVLVTHVIRQYLDLDVIRPEPGDYLVAVNGREIRRSSAVGTHESADFTFRRKRRILPDREYTLTLEQFDYAQYLRELE